MDLSQKWDSYWIRASERKGLYAAIAEFYRKFIISPALRTYFSRTFKNDSNQVYLHAGCGSSESDLRIDLEKPSYVLMDCSLEALKLAKTKTKFKNAYFVCGDIFYPPFKENSIDGIWNLGVMEHFYEPEIQKIFKAFSKILKKGGRVLLLWPPIYGLSVITLTSFLFFVNKILRKPLTLYPDEVSRFSTKKWAQTLATPAQIKINKTFFGIRDAFTYVAVVGEKE